MDLRSEGRRLESRREFCPARLHAGRHPHNGRPRAPKSPHDRRRAKPAAAFRAAGLVRPAGFARIDGRRVDVVTRGEMLDKDCPLIVVEIEGNRVVVAEHRETAGGEEQAMSKAQPEV